MNLTHLLPLAPEGYVEKRARPVDRTFKRMAYFFFGLALLICIVAFGFLDEWGPAMVLEGIFIAVGIYSFYSHRTFEKDRKKHPFTHHIIKPIRLIILKIEKGVITVRGEEDKENETAQFPQELFNRMSHHFSHWDKHMTIIVHQTLEDPNCDLLIPNDLDLRGT